MKRLAKVVFAKTGRVRARRARSGESILLSLDLLDELAAVQEDQDTDGIDDAKAKGEDASDGSADGAADRFGTGARIVGFLNGGHDLEDDGIGDGDDQQ